MKRKFRVSEEAAKSMTNYGQAVFAAVSGNEAKKPEEKEEKTDPAEQITQAENTEETEAAEKQSAPETTAEENAENVPEADDIKAAGETENAETAPATDEAGKADSEVPATEANTADSADNADKAAGDVKQTDETEEPSKPVVWQTDIGLVRPGNEDAVILDEATGLMGVADGMGGHNAGEVASNGARDLLCAFLKGKEPSENALRTGIQAANRRLYLRQQEETELSGMGTTLTVLWPDDENIYIAHVGDSRAYRLREGNMQQMTLDHSMVAEMVRQGLLTRAQAACHPMRNYITRAVGTESGVEVDTMKEPRRQGDLWLVCSDGLYGMLQEVEILAKLKQVTDRKSMNKAADELMAAALKAGGKDNITLVLYLDEGVPQ